MSGDRPDFTGADEIDEHLADDVYMDKITKRDEDWFEHLKKFVDNGASAFKLDGSKVDLFGGKVSFAEASINAKTTGVLKLEGSMIKIG